MKDCHTREKYTDAWYREAFTEQKKEDDINQRSFKPQNKTVTFLVIPFDYSQAEVSDQGGHEYISLFQLTYITQC